MIKRILSLCTTLILLFFLFGCQKDSFVIGILIYDENDTYVGELKNLLIQSLPQDVDYRIAYASRSQYNQNQQFLAFIDEGIDLFIINLVDRLAAATIVEKAATLSLPIIFINREPIEDAMKNYDRAFYVGADPEQQGEEQARLVSKIFGPPDALNPQFDKNGDGQIQMIILKGEVGHQDAEQRTSKLRDWLNEHQYPYELFETIVADWDRETAKEWMKRLHQNYGDQIELIISNNDDMALGAIDFYLEQGIFQPYPDATVFQQPIVILGVDGTQKGITAINEGLLAGTVKNDAKIQSEAIIELIGHIRSGSPLTIPLENGQYCYVPGYQIIHPAFSEHPH